MKENIINDLCTLLAYNVIGDRQFKNRFNGFIGELDFIEYFKLKHGSNIFFNGGMLIPTQKGNNPFDEAVYFTTSSDEPELYIDLFNRFTFIQCKSMFFIKWDKNNALEYWNRSDFMGVGKDLLAPELIIYQFLDGKFVESNLIIFLSQFTDTIWNPKDNVPLKIKSEFSDILMRFDIHSLTDLYVQRYVFDGLLGLKKVRGIPCDFDLIIKSHKTNNFIIFEVKEKDLSKRPPIGFGMDVPRVLFYKELINKIGCSVFYVVRQIENQLTRKFMSWRIIDMQSFIKNCKKVSVEGGTGMRSVNSNNPTWICEDSYFNRL